jgi:hypothetical protein
MEREFDNMETCNPCSEKERMTRLEKKIDSIQETTTSIRESLARLDSIPSRVSEHDDQITELRIHARVAETFATRKQFWLANAIAIAAVVLSLLQWLSNKEVTRANINPLDDGSSIVPGRTKP